MFADDAAVVANTQMELQSLMDCFSQACKDFGLTISLKKTKSWDRTQRHRRGHCHRQPRTPHALCQFTYLGSTITDDLSLDAEIGKRIRKAALYLASITAGLWTCSRLSVNTKLAVGNDCVTSTLLHGSATSTIKFKKST